MKYNKTNKRKQVNKHKKYDTHKIKHPNVLKKYDENDRASNKSYFGKLLKQISTTKPYSLNSNILGYFLILHTIIALILLVIIARTGFMLMIIVLCSQVIAVYLKLRRLFIKEILWTEFHIYESGINIKHTKGYITLSFHDIKGVLEYSGGIINGGTVYMHMFPNVLNASPIEMRLQYHEFAMIEEIFSSFLIRGLTQENIDKAIIHFDKHSRLMLKEGILHYENNKYKGIDLLLDKSKTLPLSEVKCVESLLVYRRTEILVVHICSKISKDRNIVIPEYEFKIMNMQALHEIVRINAKKISILDLFINAKKC